MSDDAQTPSSSIQAVSRQIGVSPFALFRVAWAFTVREFCEDPSSDHACFGVVTSGRDLPVHHVEEIVGHMVNMLSSHVSLSDTKSAAEAARESYLAFIDHLEHQTCSLAEIQHALNRGPLFNTGMTLQRSHIQNDEPSGLRSLSLGGQDPTDVSFPIFLSF